MAFCAINWMPHSCFQVSTSEQISQHLTSLLGFSATAKDSLSTNAELISFQRHQPCYLAELFANWHSSEQGTELWGNKQKAYHFTFSSLNLLSSCSFHFDVCPWLTRRNLCIKSLCLSSVWVASCYSLRENRMMMKAMYRLPCVTHTFISSGKAWHSARTRI